MRPIFYPENARMNVIMIVSQSKVGKSPNAESAAGLLLCCLYQAALVTMVTCNSFLITANVTLNQC